MSYKYIYMPHFLDPFSCRASGLLCTFLIIATNNKAEVFKGEGWGSEGTEPRQVGVASFPALYLFSVHLVPELELCLARGWSCG
jgi:hypothetical protein